MSNVVKLNTRETERFNAVQDYPYLIKAPHGRGDHLVCAKNIRIELKRAFPGVKFSVRYKSFSMGNSITVSWTDGPTTKQVDAIVNKYEYGRFDGMTDLSYSVDSGFMDMFGSAKYLHTSRSYSEKLVRAVALHVAGIYECEAPEIKVYEDGDAIVSERGLVFGQYKCKLRHPYHCDDIASCCGWVLQNISRA